MNLLNVNNHKDFEMLKIIVFLLSALIFISCSDDSQKLEVLQEQMSELQKKVKDSYKPGFGEFMSNIQVHHAKLWFAGINQNWELADFEIHEIEESLDDIFKYQSEREESKSLNIIMAPLDSVKNSISKKDQNLFKKSFDTLTRTCNTCHEAVKFKFNKVKIPDSPPFSNQEFK